VAKELGLNRFVCEQPPYNILDRRIERELLPFCQTYGVGVIPWSPLAGGILTGKYRQGQPRPAGSRYESGPALANRDNERALDVAEKVVELAEAKGCTPSAFALAWCLSNPAITSPIVGPRTMEQLEDNLTALSVTITPEDRAAVDALVEPGTHVSVYYQAEFGPNARW
jgi:aryl-alcohol dehydrogenase-like predicted oxidoreductase